MIHEMRLAVVATATVLLCLVSTLANANGISYKVSADPCVTGCIVAPGMNFGVITFTDKRSQQIEVAVTLVGQSFSTNAGANTSQASFDFSGPEYQPVSVTSAVSGWTRLSGRSGTSSMTFDVATPLSLDAFVQMSKFGSQDAYFAGDVVSVNGVAVNGVVDPAFIIGGNLRAGAIMNPEPASLVLLGSGLLGAAFRVRKTLTRSVLGLRFPPGDQTELPAL